MNYTSEQGEFYVVTDKSTGAFITTGRLAGGDEVSTIHDVKFITESEHNSLIKQNYPDDWNLVG